MHEPPCGLAVATDAVRQLVERERSSRFTQCIHHAGLGGRRLRARRLRASSGTPGEIPILAQVAELVDALVSGTSGAIRGGSSPLLGTSFLPILSLSRGTLWRRAVCTPDPIGTNLGKLAVQIG